jgi:release factor glutamine methyltransferase
MKAQDALRRAIPRLQEAGIEDGARDARVLLAHALGIGHDRLTLKLQDDLTGPQAGIYEEALVARMARQPVSQITGRRLFWGQSFRVTRDVLDPRPETETLVAEALREPFLKMLDLGTGSGCILLSCLKGMPMARGLGTDISDAALQVAVGNTRDLGLEARARFRKSDWFSNVTGAYDLIVSNPPYIAADELPDLAPEVRDWEPLQALTPGGDGLDAYRAIARGAGARLMPGGRILVEIGPTQGPAVAALFATAGLEGIRVLPDLDGRDRVVVAVKAGATDRCGCA